MTLFSQHFATSIVYHVKMRVALKQAYFKGPFAHYMTKSKPICSLLEIQLATKLVCNERTTL
jgi:hypothetical protein